MVELYRSPNDNNYLLKLTPKELMDLYTALQKYSIVESTFRRVTESKLIPTVQDIMKEIMIRSDLFDVR